MPLASQRKENDPGVGRLKRLSSITSIATPIGQIASRFRRPSTAVPSLRPDHSGPSQQKGSHFSRSEQHGRNTSSERTLKELLLSQQSSSDYSSQRWEPKTSAASTLLKSQTMSHLPMPSWRQASYEEVSSDRSTISLPRNVVKTSTSTDIAGKRAPNQLKEHARLRTTSTSRVPRYSTQPNLLSSGLVTSVVPNNEIKSTSAGTFMSERSRTFLMRRKQTINSSSGKIDSYEAAETGQQRRRAFTSGQQPSNEPRTPSKSIARSPRRSIENDYKEMQRWPMAPSDSQANYKPSVRHSFEQDITHRQLLQPISPPLPRLPAGYASADPSALLASARLVRQVTQAQPASYWSGRFTSLNDRLLNEALDDRPSSASCQKRDVSELSRQAEASHGEAHAQKVLDFLYAACVTKEAVDSLRLWQVRFAELKRMPNLASYTPSSGIHNLAPSSQFQTRSLAALQPISGNRTSDPNGTEDGAKETDMDGFEASIPRLEPSHGMSVGAEATIAELPGKGTSGRNMSFVDRLLSSGRRISGKSLGGRRASGNVDGADDKELTGEKDKI